MASDDQNFFMGEETYFNIYSGGIMFFYTALLVIIYFKIPNNHKYIKLFGMFTLVIRIIIVIISLTYNMQFLIAGLTTILGISYCVLLLLATQPWRDIYIRISTILTDNSLCIIPDLQSQSDTNVDISHPNASSIAPPSLPTIGTMSPTKQSLKIEQMAKINNTIQIQIESSNTYQIICFAIW